MSRRLTKTAALTIMEQNAACNMQVKAWMDQG